MAHSTPTTAQAARARLPRAGAVAAAWARAALLMLAVGAGFACRPSRADGPPRPDVPAVSPADTAGRAVDYLWVVRTSLTTPRDVERVVERARRLGVRGLIVQVVGRGDAWYRSDLLPVPEALSDPTFDPLGTLLPLAHAAGLEVHAWMNCLLVWSAPQPPRDPSHVLRAHPEWVSRLADGRPMTRLGRAERERRHVEGTFLAPAHPGVRTWLANVAREIVTRYPVDGLQLDYIRLPSIPTGFDPTTRARFALESGVDVARPELLPWTERARVDSLWTAFQSREVTAAVSEIRDSVQRARPGLPLSAAVLADTLNARRVNAQHWWDWLRDGLLERVYVMNYAPVVQTVLQQLLSYSEAYRLPGRIVPGIAVYNSPPATAAAKILGARTLGFPEIALYSYDALYEKPAYEPRLFRLLRSAPATPGSTLEAH